MNALLGLSRLIDKLSEWVGQAVYWLVLAMTLISAGNAVSRKAFDISSNAWLEIQWYLFSAVFLLAAGYTLLRNEHVRIDILSARLSSRGRAWIDVFGFVFFFFPMVWLFIDLGWPFFKLAFDTGEMSANPSGLIRWPVKLLVPVGFSLLALQGVSELIKRIAFLMGRIPDPLDKKHHGLEAGGAEASKAEAAGRKT